MPKKGKKLPTRAARAGGKSRKSRDASTTAPAAQCPAVPLDTTAATERFVSDLLIRGEAAKRDRKGKLPLDATHAIKKQKPDGSVEVERVRFKTF